MGSGQRSSRAHTYAARHGGWNLAVRESADEVAQNKLDGQDASRFVDERRAYMAKQFNGLHVFIASPGGLQNERSAFREVIDRVNFDHAHQIGITFVPCGWEYTSSGVGRPQELINTQVRESDYLVVVLWDKWGRPPGGDSEFTSGTEEEYNVALECLGDPNLPMRDIVVLFKGVNERQLADPGTELLQVLKFKESLEESRILMYSTFDTLEEFRDDFRRHLHDWVRDWQGGGDPPEKHPGPRPKPPVPPSIAIDEAPQKVDSGGDVVAAAKSAAERGRLTVAEQLYAQATTGTYDRNAFTEYVRFLRKSGRLSLAEATAYHFLEIAQNADDHIGEVEALANLAILERQQGRNESSLVYLTKATAANEEFLSQLGATESDDRSAALSTRAFLLDNESLTLRRLPDRSRDALDKLDEARAAQDEAGDRRGAGFTMRNKGSLLLRMGRLAEAEEALSSALSIFEEVEYASGQAAVLGSLGELYEAMGNYEKAIEVLDRSLAVSPQRTPSRNTMNYAILSRVHLLRGEDEQAKVYADACSRFAQELGTSESQATALHCQGALAAHELNFELALPMLLESQALFGSVDNPIGVAAVSLDLGRISVLEGRLAAARRYAEQAGRMLSTSPHYGLGRDLERLQAQLAEV